MPARERKKNEFEPFMPPSPQICGLSNGRLLPLSNNAQIHLTSQATVSSKSVRHKRTNWLILRFLSAAVCSESAHQWKVASTSRCMETVYREARLFDSALKTRSVMLIQKLTIKGEQLPSSQQTVTSHRRNGNSMYCFAHDSHYLRRN
jgi:hypothetical protein